MKDRWVFVIALALLMGTVAARSSSAEDEERTTPASEASAVADDLEAETVLATRADSLAFHRVSDRVGKRSKVRVISTAGTYELRGPLLTPAGVPVSSSLAEGSAETVVPWSSVEKFQVRGSAAGRGASIGALVLGGLGLAAGLAATGECSGEPFSFEPCEASAGDVVAITAVSTITGALVGMVIAAPFARWKTVYERGK